MTFVLETEKTPAGDQPQAIAALVAGVQQGMRHQTLLGVTGSGKTFTAANVIAAVQKPTLVIAHNKTLAAQLAQEYRELFPRNKVCYFVSYYDYYQPEAYVPASDTYIEKEAQINEEIDRLRHQATQALLTRRDVIVVASVSCIYALGSPTEYQKSLLPIRVGDRGDRTALLRRLVALHFTRTGADLLPGQFRARGTFVEIMPADERLIYRVVWAQGAVARIEAIDATTRALRGTHDLVYIFPAKHYVTPEEERKRAITAIKAELKERLRVLKREGKVLEHERLKRRTNHDLALIKEMGYCNGIENYSRHFDGRAPGEPPYTLLDYFPKNEKGEPDFLTIVDESHVTLPQIAGMYAGDRARKETLIAHGFRLPSALDNRPLTFAEFEERVGPRIYTSATPGPYEREKSVPPAGQVVEQIIRPTGLLDPKVEVRPIVARGTYPGQVADLMREITATTARGGRVLATTLTKKMAEDLTEYLKEKGVKAEYLHSDIKTIDRISIITDFRKGVFDVLVGVNLLREGLDLPEVMLVGILDADKEGFLRSETALIQTIGRAARNLEGKVLLYADEVTPSLKRAVDETRRRRKRQAAYNAAHGITPTTVQKAFADITDQLNRTHKEAVRQLTALDEARFATHPEEVLEEKRKQMEAAAKALDFETAALLRDELRYFEQQLKKERTSPQRPNAPRNRKG